MRVVLDGVAKGRGNQALSPTSCRIETGFVTVAPVDTERGPSVLSLIMAGRMRPDKGTVTCDGQRDYRRLRHGFAMVDTPSVCEPAPGVPLRAVVAEELMYAQTFANPISTELWLRQNGVREFAGTDMARVPSLVRVKILTELALARPNTQLVVLTAPDRHGIDLSSLSRYIAEVLDRGYGIAVVCGQTAEPMLVNELDRLGTPLHRAATFHGATKQIHSNQEASTLN